jgi:hypothetical protein
MQENGNDYRSFVLRIWRVREGNQAQWRVTLENIQTGKVSSYASLDDLFEFLSCLNDIVDESEDALKRT